MKMSKHVKDKISLYLDGMLKDADLKAFEAHVKTCAECANALAGTKRAVSAVPKNIEQPLPVNFYAKLNQKLDAVDAKKDAFVWGAFMRGAAAVFTITIVGVFVYNIKNQTNNFSDVRMKQDSQMPVELEGEKQGDYVMRERLTEEPVPVLKNKTAAPAKIASKDKLALDVSDKTNAGSDYSESKAFVMEKAEAVEEKKQVALGVMQLPQAAQARSVKAKAAAPAVSVLESASAPAGMSTGGGLAEESLEYAAPAPADEMDTVAAAKPYESGPQTFVFKSEKEWKEFLDGGRIGDMENIDWTKQMIVSVFLSDRPSEGYSVEITDVNYQSNRVVVYYKEFKPAAGSINAQVVTRPYRAKAVNKTNLPVAFEEAK
jgi:hypothetical protein